MCVIFVAGNRKAYNLFLVIFFLRRVKKLTPVKLLLEQNGKVLPRREIFLLVLDFDVKPPSGSQIVQCRHDAGE